MKVHKLKIFLGLTFVVLSLFISHPVYASENRYVVGYKDDISIEEVAKNFSIGEDKVKRIGHGNNFSIITTESVGGSASSENTNIKFFQPDYEYKIFTTPNDTNYASQWALTKISSTSAWDTTTGSNTLKIAVIDTGVNGTHEDLSGKIIAGYDFVNDTAISANMDSDDNGHGTLVSGVAAADTNNNLGIAGLDWNAKIIPVKALNSSGTGYASEIASAIEYAVDNGASVINMSFGGSESSSVMEDAINYAANHNVVTVAASGNEGTAVSYPAKYASVVAVGATDSSDNRASWSNYGSELDVTAPGVSILSTADSGGYESVSGTSIASPYVAALASLVKAKYPDFSASQIASMIDNNADKVSGMGGNNFTEYYGYGRINAQHALIPIASSDPSTYQYEIASQNGYPTLSPGQSYNFNFVIKNTGTSTWYKYRVNLGTDRALDRIPGFIRADNVNGNNSGWYYDNRIYMQEDMVVPGQTATFSFWYTIPNGMSSGTYQEYFRPVADGVTWMQDKGVYWNINIRSLTDSYHYQVVSQNDYPTLSPGQSYNYTIQVKNTGNTTWNKYQVNLAPDRPRDRITGFIREDLTNHNDSGWYYYNRIYLQQDTVAPGETGTFSFWMTVPNGMAPGTYREYFRMVADNITWMEDYGVYWDIRVQ